MAITIPEQCMLFTWNFVNSQGSGVSDVAEFSCSARMLSVIGNDEPPDPLDSATMAAIIDVAALAAYEGWADNFSTALFPTCLTLDNVRCAFRNSAGLTIVENRAIAPVSPWVGVQTKSLPWSDALVISNYGYVPNTFVTNQKRKRGRSYLPQFAVDIYTGNGYGALTDAQAADMANSFDLMWQEIRAADYSGTGITGFAPFPGIVSPADHAFYPTAYWRCDNIIDTQRRRRNRETATYQDLAVLTGS